MADKYVTQQVGRNTTVRMLEQDSAAIEAMRQAERDRADSVKQRLAAIRERQGKGQSTLEDVVELLVMVAEKMGVG